uniref:NADH dehydrogenase subunit 2 n=1 Tax=Arion flagellus TaxID=236857 RepID=UPI00240EBEEE|nr:NADH dehydrogenase subunit 2 [Arion flagellus]WES82243.1 NADH dehydrogenase subunit 2 [Arion flagellus]
MLVFSSFLLGPMMAITSSNWWVIWLMMEILTFSMIVSIYFSNSLILSEVSMIYFVAQSVSGVFLLVGGSYVIQLLNSSNMFLFMLSLGLTLKLGLFPTHFWVLPLVSMISYWQIAFLLGPMKIIPLNLLLTLGSDSWGHLFLLSLGFMSMLYGSKLGIMMASIKGVLGASSITHSGWFILAYSYNLLWVYFWAYYFSLLLFLMSMTFLMGKMAAWGMLSLSGLPPFVLFFAKASVVWAVLSSFSSPLLLVLPLLSAMISLYFYLKYVYSLWLSSTMDNSSSMMWFVMPNMFMGSMLLML